MARCFSGRRGPRVISFTLADPGDLAGPRRRVAGDGTGHQQAVQAAERGVDVIIAQGGESGGCCGEVSTMALVPQVVNAVSPIPVVASGGIFGGRGIAAALMLGAVGVNLGTRFIASQEAPGSAEWELAILNASSEDARKFEVLNDISPLPGADGYSTGPGRSKAGTRETHIGSGERYMGSGKAGGPVEASPTAAS
jgi:enoyl-[acyl-carrier protein] reductase II